MRCAVDSDLLLLPFEGEGGEVIGRMYMYLPDEKGTLTITLHVHVSAWWKGNPNHNTDPNWRWLSTWQKRTKFWPKKKKRHFRCSFSHDFDSIFSNTHSDIDRRLSISPIMKSFNETLKEYSPVWAWRPI